MDHDCKYIETSCTISLNLDYLIVGIGAQINLKSSFKGKRVNLFPRKILENFLFLDTV
jgi:hypothetical protein